MSEVEQLTEQELSKAALHSKPCSAKNGDWELAGEAEPRRGHVTPMEALCGIQAVGADDGNRRRALEFAGKQRAGEQVIPK